MRAWSKDQTYILVCKKCGKKMLSSEDGGDPARALAKVFKRALRALFGKKNFRVLTTSCLKLCPKDQVSVAVLSSGCPTQLLTVGADEGFEATSAIRDFLERKSQNSSPKK